MTKVTQALNTAIPRPRAALVPVALILDRETRLLSDEADV
jgi:hypothetical protein